MIGELIVALAAGLGAIAIDRKAQGAKTGGAPSSTVLPLSGVGPAGSVPPIDSSSTPGGSAPAMRLAPGLYAPGTPGSIPVAVTVVGGDNDARITATPGGMVGPFRGASQVFWYGPGTYVSFRASVDPFGPVGSPLTAFDHFEGPGVFTRQNPIQVPIVSAGYVRAVFSFLGRAGG